MIIWTGESTNGNWKREEKVKTMSELYEACRRNGTISEIDYDPRLEFLVERAGYDYDAIDDMISRRMEENHTDMTVEYDKWMKENNVSDTLSDRDYMNIIERETGNAFYQTFRDEYDTDLEFDEKGMIPDTRMVREVVLVSEWVPEEGYDDPVTAKNEIISMERDRIDEYFDFDSFVADYFGSRSDVSGAKIEVLRFYPEDDIDLCEPMEKEEEIFGTAEIEKILDKKKQTVVPEKEKQPEPVKQTPRLKL